MCTKNLVLLPFPSYNLFASNVILASISFVYFPNDRWPATLINVFTLLGSVVGQILFGFLADWYGRTRLYGIELALVIISTIGVATSNSGYNDMSFLALFVWVSSLPCRESLTPTLWADRLPAHSGALSWVLVSCFKTQAVRESMPVL